MMADTAERPGITERYSSAIESSNLKLSDIRQGDPDILIAAAWAGNGIGTRLTRLRAEYDIVRAEHAQAERAMKAGDSAADVLQARYAAERERMQYGPTFAEVLRQRTEAAQKEARASAVTARALILIKLKTLSSTKDALGGLVVIQATKTRYMKPDKDALRVAGRCLELWLDPVCASCSGRGFTGGYNGPQHLCRPCGGSKRREFNGIDDADNRFAKHIMALMDRAADGADAEMKKRLNWSPDSA